MVHAARGQFDMHKSQFCGVNIWIQPQLMNYYSHINKCQIDILTLPTAVCCYSNFTHTFLPQFSMHFVSMIPAANRLKFIQWPFLLPLKTIRIVLVIVWIVKNALLQNVLLKKTPAMICDVSIFLAVSALNMESGGSGNLKEYTDCEQIESKWDSSGCKLHFKMKENYGAVCGPTTSHQSFRHIHSSMIIRLHM